MNSDLPWEDAIGAVDILMKTGRTVDGAEWIDTLVNEQLNDSNESLF